MAIKISRKNYKKLFKLARRALHTAFIWNDRNFKDAHLMLEDTANECGIESANEADEFLSSLPEIKQRRPFVARVEQKVSAFGDQSGTVISGDAVLNLRNNTGEEARKPMIEDCQKTGKEMPVGNLLTVTFFGGRYYLMQKPSKTGAWRSGFVIGKNSELAKEYRRYISSNNDNGDGVSGD